jgi:hypothetical protein
MHKVDAQGETFANTSRVSAFADKGEGNQYKKQQGRE